MISIEGNKPKKLAYKSSKTFHRGIQQNEGGVVEVGVGKVVVPRL